MSRVEVELRGRSYPGVQHDAGFEDIQRRSRSSCHSTRRATTRSSLIRVEPSPAQRKRQATFQELIQRELYRRERYLHRDPVNQIFQGEETHTNRHEPRE